MYLLVKSVVPKVSWSLHSSLPWNCLWREFPFSSETNEDQSEVEIDGTAIYRQRLKPEFCQVHERHFSGAISLCLKSYGNAKWSWPPKWHKTSTIKYFIINNFFTITISKITDKSPSFKSYFLINIFSHMLQVCKFNSLSL